MLIANMLGLNEGDTVFPQSNSMYVNNDIYRVVKINLLGSSINLPRLCFGLSEVAFLARLAGHKKSWWVVMRRKNFTTHQIDKVGIFLMRYRKFAVTMPHSIYKINWTNKLRQTLLRLVGLSISERSIASKCH